MDHLLRLDILDSTVSIDMGTATEGFSLSFLVDTCLLQRYDSNLLRPYTYLKLTRLDPAVEYCSIT
jgi:hypothetical protein